MTRHEARAKALQALYQIDVGKAETMPAVVHVLEEDTPTDNDLRFIRRLVEGAVANTGEMDSWIEANVEGWQFDRIGRIERNVLRLSLYELQHEHETDTATILNEAVELAKEYSGTASGKFVNGVLAKLLPLARPE